MKDVDETYQNVISGGLKLKGKVISKTKGSKKVLKSAVKPQSSVESYQDHSSRDYITIPVNSEYQNQSSGDSDELYERNPDESKSEILNKRIERVKNDPNLTSSEKTFKIAQIKRTYQRIQQSLKESHREKIEKFNAKLSNLSEHFDIPKVGPG